jgi:capsular exopolysaccharide synthesis family protein
MELIEYWKVISKRLWLIVLFILASVSIAIVIGESEERYYRASTTLFLNPVADSPMWPYYRSEGTTLAEDYATLVRSGQFAHQVAQEPSIPLSKEEVQSSLITTYDPDSQFFTISAEHPQPEVARDLANTAAEVFVAENAARLQAQQQQIEDERTPMRPAERQQLTQLQSILQDELSYINEQIRSVQAEIANLQGQTRSERLNERVGSLISELFGLRSLRADVLANMPTSIMQEAQLPTSPVPSNTLVYVIQAITIGLVLGIGLAFALEYLDYTFREPDMLGNVYGRPTQSVLGKMRSKSDSIPLAAIDEPSSQQAEAFRALRLLISAASLDTPIRSVLLTSAVPGEGKTFIAANLAISIAQNARRTILVDTNVRQPRIHEAFDVPLTPGLTDMLCEEQADYRDYLQPTSVDHLWVLPAGTTLPNAADLLGAQRMRDLMRALADDAEIVVYDSPAITSVTDGLVLAAQVDGVFQVVKAGGPRIDVVLRAKSLLDGVEANVLGPVLNQASKLPKTGYYAPEGKRRTRTAPPEEVPEAARANGSGTVRTAPEGAVNVAERGATTAPPDEAAKRA